MAKQDVDNWIDSIVRDVAELPDRDSPDEHPEMMTVSDKELRDIIRARCEKIAFHID